MFLSKKISGWLMLALSLCIPLALMAEERVVVIQAAQGEYKFQIQNIEKEQQYTLEILNAKTGELVHTVKELQKTPLPDVLQASFTADKELNVLCYWRLLKNGTDVSGELKQEEMPEKFHVGQVKMKRATGELIWSQDTPAISRVFVANRSGMLIAWAKDWSFASTGGHACTWSFRDEQGVRDYRNDSDIHAFVQMVPLSKRWLILGDVDFDQSFIEIEALKQIELPNVPYDFNLSLPKSETSKENGETLYQVKSGQPLRVKLDTASRAKIGGRRYEILLFLNGEFVHEEAQGVDPYTYILPQMPGVTGKHVITVNMIDYHGNIASRSINVDIQP